MMAHHGPSRKRYASYNFEDEREQKKFKLDTHNEELPNVPVSTYPRKHTYHKGGLSDTLHGDIYQLKILILFIKRALEHGYTFHLGTEVEEAEKFDDVVFVFNKGKNKTKNERDEIRFLQAKHKQDESKKITITDLQSPIDSRSNEYSLPKYLMSYLKIKKNPLFFSLKVKDFIIYTNIGFDDLGSIKTEKIGLSDEILDLKKSGGTMQLCKLIVPKDHELYQQLRKNPELHLLVNTIKQHIDDKKVFQLTNKVFKDYHIALCANVFDIVIKKEKNNRNRTVTSKFAKFKTDFLDGKNLSKEVHNFRNIFYSALPTKDWKTLKQKEFKISDGFGQIPVSTQSQAPKNDLPSDKIDDAEIDDFFEKLVFAVNQPNEDELGEMITAEFGELSRFNLMNATTVTNSFQRNILDWFKEKLPDKGNEGVWLNAQSGQEFLKSIENEVNGLISVGLSVTYPEKLSSFGIKFKNNKIFEALKSFLSLNNVSKRILRVIASKETLLSAINIYSSLEDLKTQDEFSDYKRNDCYIFIRLRTLLGERVRQYILDALTSKHNYHLLIIDCVSDAPPLEMIKGIIKSTNKKIIVLINKEQGKKSYHDLTLSVEDDTGFADLTEISKEFLLSKKIIFQDEKISFSKLIGKSDDIREKIINVEVILKLLKGEEIRVNSLGQNLGEVNEYYIMRRFRRVILSKQNILRYLEESGSQSDLFVICGRDSGLNHYNVFSVDGIMLGEDKFVELCNENKDRNIHLLETNAKNIIWCQSYGSISNIVKCRASEYYYVQRNVCHLEENALLHESNRNKIFIISDTAGMGKSTVLSHLQMGLKKYVGGLWVFKVNLNDHTTMLYRILNNNKIKFIDYNKNELADFLLNELLASQIKSELEKKLFYVHFCKNGKVAFLFDGFDEICPDYKEIVIDLLQALKTLKVDKIYVTSRPNLQQDLEHVLGVFSHAMEPLSKQEQINFLTLFWTNKLELGPKCKVKLNIYVTSIIDYISKSTYNTKQDFIGVALQTMMVGEVFQDNIPGIKVNLETCKEFLNSERSVPQLPTNFGVLDLYEHFISNKFYKMYLKSKKGRDFTKVGELNAASREYNIFKDKCAILAFPTLFTEEKVKELLTLKEQRALRDFIEDFKYNEHNEGIIDLFRDDKPLFVHRTFAEYFVSLPIGDKLLATPVNILCCLENVISNMSPVFICNLIKQLDGQQEKLTISLKKPLLHFIITENYLELIKSLLKIDLNDWPKKLDISGKSPLHYAVEHDHLNIIEKLLEYSDDIHETNILKHGSFKNPDYSKSQLVHFVNLLDCHGKSALFYALQKNLMDLCFELLLKGANTDFLIDEEIDKLITKMLTIKLNFDVYNNSILAAYPDSRNKYRPIQEKLFLRAPDAFKKQSEKHQSTILSYFLIHGRVQVIDALLETVYESRRRQKILNNPVNGQTALDRVNYSDQLTDNERLQMTKYLLERNCTRSTRNTDYITQILEAASRNGSIKTFKYFIAQDTQNCYYRYFCLACSYNQLNILDYLIKHHKENINNGALHGICDSNARLKIMKYLIDNNSNVNATNDKGETPLLVAIQSRRSLNVIEYLVNIGSNINCVDMYGNTPLSRAIERGDNNIIKYLLNKGADISEGASQLTKDKADYFKDPNHYDIDKLDNNGNLRLHTAIRDNNYEWTQFLVRHGADIHKVDTLGKTALHWACAVKNTKIVELLLQYGAMFDMKDNNNEIPWNLALQSEKQNSKIFWLMTVLHKLFNSENFMDELYKELLDDSTNAPFTYWGPYGCGFPNAEEDSNPTFILLNARNSKGTTLLHLAASYANDTKAIDTLLKFNSDYIRIKKEYKGILHDYEDYQPVCVNMKDSQGNTPLHIASQKGHFMTTSALLKEGAIFNVQNLQGETPEVLASQNGHKSIVELHQEINKMFCAIEENNILEFVYLIKEKKIGCYINAKNGLGQTLLHLTASLGHIVLLQLLLDNGANIEGRDLNKNTPLHIAAQNGKGEIIKHLLAHGAIYNSRNSQELIPFDLVPPHSYDILDVLGQIDALFNGIKSDNPHTVINSLLKMVKTCNVDVETITNVRDELGNTLLHYAAESCECDVVKFLLEHGACYDMKNVYDRPPVFFTADKKINLLFKSIENMFKNTSDIYQERNVNLKIITNVRDHSRKRLIYYAIKSRYVEIVKYLVERGANIDLIDIDYSMLSLESLNVEKNELIKFLIDKCDINITNYMGETPLIIAIKANSSKDIIQYLVTMGADVNQKDLLGNTSLSYAIEHDKEDIIDFLLSKGAHVSAKAHPLIKDKISAKLMSSSIKGISNIHLNEFMEC